MTLEQDLRSNRPLLVQGTERMAENGDRRGVDEVKGQAGVTTRRAWVGFILRAVGSQRAALS